MIGINSQIYSGSSGGGSIGIGFAVPIDTAKAEIAQLEKGGTVSRAYIGLTSITIDGSLSALNLPVKSGALVQSVQKGTPAEKAGIRGGNLNSNIESGQVAVGGDIITSVDGQTVNSSEDLANDIGSKNRTGLSSRMAASISPRASPGCAGITTFKPGTWANQTE